MPAHELLRQVKAKSLSVKISRNDPNTARVNWQLADGEFLTVEIPRYVLERFMVQAKRAIEEAPLLSLVSIQAGSGEPVGTISASSSFLGKWRCPACGAGE
jgi:hypothetical protein